VDDPLVLHTCLRYDPPKIARRRNFFRMRPPVLRRGGPPIAAAAAIFAAGHPVEVDAKALGLGIGFLRRWGLHQSYDPHPVGEDITPVGVCLPERVDVLDGGGERCGELQVMCVHILVYHNPTNYLGGGGT